MSHIFFWEIIHIHMVFTQLLFRSCCRSTELLYASSSRSTEKSGTREMLEQFLKAKGIL